MPEKFDNSNKKNDINLLSEDDLGLISGGARKNSGSESSSASRNIIKSSLSSAKVKKTCSKCHKEYDAEVDKFTTAECPYCKNKKLS